MECYACSNEATRQCRRCARVYCELHGGELCAECLSPASALPSFNLYRGSLLALLVGTAVALWLIVRPPGSGNGDEISITQVTPTPPFVTQVLTTPTATAGTAEPDATGTPRRTATPDGNETAEPREYVVQEGDTLLSIAEATAPPGVDPFEYASQIAFANGFAPEDPIQPGETLILP